MTRLSPLDLLKSSVGPRTWGRYKSALRRFMAFLDERRVREVGNLEELDRCIMDFFGVLLSEGGSRALAVDVRSAILVILPNARWGLNGSRRVLRGWTKLCPVNQKAPIPWELYQLVLKLFREKGNKEAEWMTMACFEGYLRVSEAAGVLMGDVVIREDHGVIALPKTKTGLNQSILIREGPWLALTRSLWRRRKGDSKLVNMSASSYRNIFRRALATLGVQPGTFTPHSLRHGGATDDFIQGIPMADIIVRGRWAFAKNASRYIQQGRALLLRVRLSEGLKRRMEAERRARRRSPFVCGGAQPRKRR